MKRIIVAALLTGLVYFGCSDLGTNNQISPVQTAHKELIKLPAKAALSKDKPSSSSKEISNSRGGVIFLSDSYKTHERKRVSVFASLFVPAGAFDQSDVDITMTADPEYAAVIFQPHMVFNKSLTLNLTYTGLDLHGMNTQDIGFYYVADDGSEQPVQYAQITVLKYFGTIILKGAKIDHFSRYAFSK